MPRSKRLIASLPRTKKKVFERIGPDAYPLMLAALSTFRSG
jgi:hypothetical protein